MFQTTSTITWDCPRYDWPHFCHGCEPDLALNKLLSFCKLFILPGVGWIIYKLAVWRINCLTALISIVVTQFEIRELKYSHVRTGTGS